MHCLSIQALRQGFQYVDREDADVLGQGAWRAGTGDPAGL